MAPRKPKQTELKNPDQDEVKMTYLQLSRAGAALDRLTSQKLSIIEVTLPLSRIKLALEDERDLLQKLRGKINDKYLDKDNGRTIQVGVNPDGSPAFQLTDTSAFADEMTKLLETVVAFDAFQPVKLQTLLDQGTAKEPFKLEGDILAPLLSIGAIID